jgi:hypothetical protein
LERVGGVYIVLECARAMFGNDNNKQGALTTYKLQRSYNSGSGRHGYIKQQQRLPEPLQLLSLDSGLWVTRLHHQQQQRLQEPLLFSSLGSGRHGPTINSSSGYKSRCCYRLWVLGDNATSPTTAAATRAAAVLVSGFWATTPRHQQQQRLQEPLLSVLWAPKEGEKSRGGGGGCARDGNPQ